ncbi:cold shock and DUF1294 domain-containing protein [Leeia sp. TBRC 13508]|uniref:Cold shock and DUF1294 domain-containing protein n=1 Tax=Leeia speluncae TaxID=2884804 RepID=A0ABS8D3T9_9NEIS|nr:cold shock and DUF1294 domain-containing protein [Leeia speluncae]MCB6182864.1 cold shock and DUF1294 domain-containing protein [Leeia speluncae]
MAPRRLEGHITKWNDDRGFGFVLPEGNKQTIFIHAKAFTGNVKRPSVGDRVSFQIGRDRQKRPIAIHASNLTQEAAQTSTAANPTRLGLILAAVFMIAVIALVWFSVLPVSILVMTLILSSFTFIRYAMDKYAATHQLKRTPEIGLHLLALFCGWPGAALAQHFLRHKSEKNAFRRTFWITVALNVFFISGIPLLAK